MPFCYVLFIRRFAFDSDLSLFHPLSALNSFFESFCVNRQFASKLYKFVDEKYEMEYYLGGHSAFMREDYMRAMITRSIFITFSVGNQFATMELRIQHDTFSDNHEIIIKTKQIIQKPKKHRQRQQRRPKYIHAKHR